MDELLRNRAEALGELAGRFGRYDGDAVDDIIFLSESLSMLRTCREARDRVKLEQLREVAAVEVRVGKDVFFENPTVDDIVTALESIYGQGHRAATESVYWALGGVDIEVCDKSIVDHERCKACGGKDSAYEDFDLFEDGNGCDECEGFGYELCGDSYAFRCRYPDLDGPTGSSFDIEPTQEGGITIRVSDHTGPIEHAVEFYSEVPFSLKKAQQMIDAALEEAKAKDA